MGTGTQDGVGLSLGQVQETEGEKAQSWRVLKNQRANIGTYGQVICQAQAFLEQNFMYLIQDIIAIQVCRKKKRQYNHNNNQ